MAKAARKNIKKAQAAWRGMSRRARSLAQPEGRGRRRPGMGGGGRFYRIEVRPTKGFMTFRTQDVGERGHLERVAGKRASGKWDTVTWLVNKGDAHVRNGKELVIDTPRVRTALKQIRGRITRVKGDIFAAKPRRDIPEAEKPTPRQRRAQIMNIRKAQKARHKVYA